MLILLIFNRAIAQSEDTVAAKNGMVYVNEQPLMEDYGVLLIF
jgi:hypothetical protein